MACNPCLVPFDTFSLVHFSITTVNQTMQNDLEQSTTLQLQDAESCKEVTVKGIAQNVANLVGKRILSITNPPNGMQNPAPVIFNDKNNSPCFLTVEKDDAKGNHISIGFDKPKPKTINAELLPQIDLRAGSVIEIKPFEDATTLFLKVDFGPSLGQRYTTLPETNPSEITLGRKVVAFTNMKPECYHDSRTHLICYVNKNGQNIPFSIEDRVQNGAEFVSRL